MAIDDRLLLISMIILFTFVCKSMENICQSCTGRQEQQEDYTNSCDSCNKQGEDEYFIVQEYQPNLNSESISGQPLNVPQQLEDPRKQDAAWPRKLPTALTPLKPRVSKTTTTKPTTEKPKKKCTQPGGLWFIDSPIGDCAPEKIDSSINEGTPSSGGILSGLLNLLPFGVGNQLSKIFSIFDTLRNLIPSFGGGGSDVSPDSKPTSGGDKSSTKSPKGLFFIDPITDKPVPGGFLFLAPVTAPPKGLGFIDSDRSPSPRPQLVVRLGRPPTSSLPTDSGLNFIPGVVNMIKNLIDSTTGSRSEITTQTDISFRCIVDLLKILFGSMCPKQSLQPTTTTTITTTSSTTRPPFRQLLPITSRHRTEPLEILPPPLPTPLPFVQLRRLKLKQCPCRQKIPCAPLRPCTQICPCNHNF